jgi:hypothetical protein
MGIGEERAVQRTWVGADGHLAIIKKSSIESII